MCSDRHTLWIAAGFVVVALCTVPSSKKWIYQSPMKSLNQVVPTRPSELLTKSSRPQGRAQLINMSANGRTIDGNGLKGTGRTGKPGKDSEPNISHWSATGNAMQSSRKT